jgi:predicted GNAT family acetyltransferase
VHYFKILGKLLIVKYNFYKICSFTEIGAFIMIEFKEGHNKFYLGDDEDNIKAEVTFINSGENIIILNHTYVIKELRGQNIGQQLVKKVVDYARENNKKLIPQCWFAEEEFIAHREYNDVWYK